MSYVQQIREKVGTSRIFAPGVRAVIVNQQKEILLQRRTDNLLWGVPGGSVEMDETAWQALKREVAEETALEVIEAEPMGLYSGPKQRFDYPNGDQVQCFAIAFIVLKWQGRARADGEEGAELRFFPLSRLPDDLVPVHRQTIADYMRYDGKFLLSE